MVVTETNCTVRSEKNHFYAMRDYISIKKSLPGFTETREMIGGSTWWSICQCGNLKTLKFKLLLLNILKIKAFSAKIIDRRM